MQTDAQTADPVHEALRTLRDVGDERAERVLSAIFAAIYQHQETGDAAVLVTMSRDIAFTMRVQRSEHYRKLLDNTPQTPSGNSRPVSEVLDDLGM